MIPGAPRRTKMVALTPAEIETVAAAYIRHAIPALLAGNLDRYAELEERAYQLRCIARRVPERDA